MKASKVIEIILNVIIVVLFLDAGITVLLLRHMANEYDAALCGTVILITGVAKILVFIISQAYKTKRFSPLITGVLMVLFSFIFYFGKHNLDTLCFGWGIFEIATCLYEIQDEAFEIKEDKMAIAEIAIDVACIVFGVLLCFELSGGLHVHLIFAGISLLLMSASALVKFIITLVRKKQ